MPKEEFLPSSTERMITPLTLGVSFAQTLKLSHDQKEYMQDEASLPLVYYIAAIPGLYEELKMNPKKLAALSSVICLGVNVNDAVDVLPYLRVHDPAKANDLFKQWKTTKRNPNLIEDTHANYMATAYQRELLYLERNFHEAFIADWTFEQVLKYRELANAMGIVATGSVALGANVPVQRTAPINKKEMSLANMENKYRWIIQGVPSNQPERILCGAYNISMGLQVLDDLLDIEDDNRLGITTLGTFLSATYPCGQVKEILTDAANRYFTRSTDYGVSPRSAWLIAHGVPGLKFLMRTGASKVGGMREKILYSR